MVYLIFDPNQGGMRAILAVPLPDDGSQIGLDHKLGGATLFGPAVA